MDKKAFMVAIIMFAFLFSLVVTRTVLPNVRAQDASGFNASTFSVNIASPTNGSIYARL